MPGGGSRGAPSGRLTALWKDESGIILPIVTLMLVAIIGLTLLAVDGARYVGLNSQLQKAADALAIAGAAELDGRPGAMARAEAAIDNLVSNNHVFGDDADQVVGHITPRFLSGLPADGVAPIPVSFDATGDGDARFVQVTVEPETLSAIMPAGFLGGPSTVATQASAVAGFTAAVCRFTPMFICNPFEGETFDGEPLTIQVAAAERSIRRRLIRLHTSNGGPNALTRGAFGLLQPPGPEQTLPVLKDMLAVDAPPACFGQAGVRVKPGVSGVGDWINVRFDRYVQGQTIGLKDNSAYRPSHNVRKGYKRKATGPNPACNSEPDDTGSSKGLPRDGCFATDTCPYLAGDMGDGTFDLTEYWDVNFQTTPPADLSGATRYEIYKYEVDNGLLSHQSDSPTNEIGDPVCSSSTVTPDIDRRILYAAVLNCQSLSIKGNSGGPFPVEAFAEFFLTEPVIHEPSDPEAIWVELVRTVEPGDDTGVAHDVVQLYR